MTTTNKTIISTVIIGLLVYGLASLLSGHVTMGIYVWLVCAVVCVAGCVMLIETPATRPIKYRYSRYNRSDARASSATHYTVAEWRALCAQHKHRCLSCGKKARLAADHVIPLSVGGSDDISNIQPLCKPCNSKKGARTIDYRMP